MQTLSTLQILHRKFANPLMAHNYPSPTYNQETRDVEVKKTQYNFKFKPSYLSHNCNYNFFGQMQTLSTLVQLQFLQE